MTAVLTFESEWCPLVSLLTGSNTAAAHPFPLAPRGWDWGRWLLILPWTKAAASIHARIIWRWGCLKRKFNLIAALFVLS